MHRKNSSPKRSFDLSILIKIIYNGEGNFASGRPSREKCHLRLAVVEKLVNLAGPVISLLRAHAHLADAFCTLRWMRIVLNQYP